MAVGWLLVCVFQVKIPMADSTFDDVHFSVIKDNGGPSSSPHFKTQNPRPALRSAHSLKRHTRNHGPTLSITALKGTLLK